MRECIDCNTSTTRKWYSGPRCCNCYKSNWKKGIRQPKTLLYNSSTKCSNCSTSDPKRHTWYKGPLCRDCFRLPRLITGKFHKKRDLEVGVEHPHYDTLYRRLRRSVDSGYKGETNQRTRAYQINKRRRTPINLSEEHKEQIKQIYRECPKGLSVDHIIPLNGKNVSGLHVPWNLQYLSRSENSRKGNRVA